MSEPVPSEAIRSLRIACEYVLGMLKQKVGDETLGERLGLMGGYRAVRLLEEAMSKAGKAESESETPIREALDAMRKERDDLLAAIRKHRCDVWGSHPVYDKSVPDPEDQALYEAARRCSR